MSQTPIEISSCAWQAPASAPLLDLSDWPADYSGPAQFHITDCVIEAAPGGGIKITPRDI